MPTTGMMTYTDTLTVMECHRCHISYAMPVQLYDQARRDESITFYCPAGHGAVFRNAESPEAKRARLAERRAVLAERAAANARDDARVATLSARGHKAAATRARNRAARGQCPAPGCRRPFTSVAEHVAACHPELSTADRTE